TLPMTGLLSFFFSVLSLAAINPASDNLHQGSPTVITTQVPIVHAAEQVYLPSTLNIPTINLQVPILSVGAAADGTQAVPADNSTVSWWKYGAKPGERGSAVLAGHFKIEDGSPGVFYNLNRVKVGENIEITDDQGNIQQFRVVDRKIYSVEDFPTQQIY